MGKKEGFKEEEILYEAIQEFSMITCSSCYDSDETPGDGIVGSMVFKSEGWRGTRYGNVYCPKCAKKKLKSKRK